MNNYFTSDLHFGHQNIIKYCNRPWETVAKMDEQLITNWNMKVDHDDTVWCIGDMFFCEAGRAKEIMGRLNGKKNLILGNHDKMIRNQVPVQNLFEKIYPDLHAETINGIYVVMCHYPLLSWNRAFRGAYMLHGHVHSKVPTNGEHRRYDVGVDANNYAPVEFTEIKRVLEKINQIDPSTERANRAIPEL
jgi:calcineurin-like phosphoesterase family protein